MQRTREPQDAEGGGPGSRVAARRWGECPRQPQNATSPKEQVAAAFLLPLALRSLPGCQLMSPCSREMNDPRGWHLPSISRATCSRELKVQEKGDDGTKCKDFPESKGCFANTTSFDQRVTPSSSVATGLNISEPSGACQLSAHLDPAADLYLKSSSSPSDHSSEISLPKVQEDKYPEEFSLLKLQTKDGQRPEWTFYPRFSSSIHTYHVGKQCFFNGVFLGNKRSLSEMTVDKCFGRKKYGNIFLLDLDCAMPENTLDT